MKKNKVLKKLEKLKKIIITVICIITVFFSMPVKSNANAGILESIGSFILLVPDGVQLLLNLFVSDETEDMSFFIRVEAKDEGADIFTNNTGSLYNIEVTPYDIFTAGTPTPYGEYIEAKDKVSNAGVNLYERTENAKDGSGSLTYNVQASKDAQNAINDLESKNIGQFTTTSLVKMPLLDANFFKKSTGDNLNSADILRPIVANVYKNLRNFVLIIMLLILLYIGIRIIISSAVAEQVKYKQYLFNWLVGICLIFLMQYIMSAIMNTTKAVNSMLITNIDGETYRIGFGTKDSETASIYRKSARPFNSSMENVPEYDYSTTEPVNLLDDAPEYQNTNLFAQLLSVTLNALADNENETNGDGWTELANSSDKKIANFIGRKIEIADNGTVFSFDEDNKTVSDYLSDISGESTEINAGIYDGSINGFRAIYTCNIAEFCRTITTYSTKYTHLYTNNKTTVMTNSDDEKENDYAAAAFWGYAVLYVLITIETVVFLYKYLKRVLWLAFLTMIAPLIAVMYPVDKIGDGKAQTFNMWFKEYLFNSLIQPLHILLYTIFIGIGMQLISTNVIYGIVAYAFMIPAEKFFKKMFGFDKASTPGGLGSPAAGMMAMRGLDKIGGFGPHGKGKRKDGKLGGPDGGKSKIKFAKNKLGYPGGLSGGENSAKTSGGKLGKTPGTSTLSIKGNPSGVTSNSAGGSSGRFGKRIVGMGNAAGNRIARKITGGRTSSLGKALFSPSGWAAMALNGGKTVGRNVFRIAGGTAGALTGVGAGLVAGGIASALTGEDQLMKGASTGAAVGGNRGAQTSDSLRGLYNDLNESGKEYLASTDAGYAAKLQAQEIFDKNDYMSDDDRKKVENVILAGASKDEVTNSLDKILKSQESASSLAFKAHLNNEFKLDTNKGYKEAIDTYAQNVEEKGVSFSDEQINKKKKEILEKLEEQEKDVLDNTSLGEDARNRLLRKINEKKSNADELAKKACYTDVAKKIVDQGRF